MQQERRFVSVARSLHLILFLCEIHEETSGSYSDLRIDPIPLFMTAKFKSLASAQFPHIARLEEKEDLIPEWR
jgi:hypothetical protein